VTAPGLVAHVSERQTTRLQAGKSDAIHSSVENKTIIFLVRDAVGVLGYTGTAYIRGKPTDEWLAKRIAPTAFGGPDQFAFSIGGNRRDKLNDVIWRLRKALAGGDLRHNEELAICIGGFRVRRHRWVSFQAEFGWPPSFIADSFHMRRPKSMKETWAFSQIGDTFPDDKVMASLSAAVPEAQAAGEHPYVGAMARLIRARSTQSRFVGANLMAVWIPQPRQKRVLWEFMPAQTHQAAIISPTTTRTFDAIFSPWIISPGCISRPSFGTGHFSVSTCGWTIEPVEPRIRETGQAPQASGRILFAMSNQERKPPPR
jgi:hypothetical protein